MNHGSMIAAGAGDEMYQFRFTVGLCGACFSTVGYCLMLATAALFPAWRASRQNQLWLNMCGSYLVFFCSDYYTFVYPIESRLTSGIVAHVNMYLVRVSLCWMLAGAYLTYKNLVDVFKDVGDRYILKASLWSWLLPVPFVMSMYLIYRFRFSDEIHERLRLRIGCNLLVEGKLRTSFWFFNCILDNFLVVVPIYGSIFLYLRVTYSLYKNRKVFGHERDLASAVALGFFFVFTCCLQCTIISAKFLFALGGIWNYVSVLLMAFHVSTYTTLFIICNKKTRDMWSNFLKSKLSKRRSSSHEFLK